MEIDDIETAPQALGYLVKEIDEIQTKLEPHDFMCLLAYLKEKYMG